MTCPALRVRQAVNVSCNAMTTQHQQLSFSTKRLYLPKGRLFQHYLDCFILAAMSLFLLFLIAKVYIDKQGHYDSPYLLLFLLFFPFLTLLAYFNKRQELRLKEIQTSLSKQGNYQAVKETIKALGWHIKVDNKGFIEAHKEGSGFFWTWPDQMASFLIMDNKIAFNSIGNVDNYTTQAFCWGQHSRSIKQFRNTFELISTKQYL
jgi:hypothetical protein